MNRPTIVVDLLNACANPMVARVVLQSLRQEAFERVRIAAAAHGMSPGAFAAARVRSFAQTADDALIDDLAARMARVDHPVLAGFEAIVATTARPLS